MWTLVGVIKFLEKSVRLINLLEVMYMDTILALIINLFSGIGVYIIALVIIAIITISN